MTTETKPKPKHEAVGQRYIEMMYCESHDDPRIEVCPCGEVSPFFVHLQGEGQDEVAHCDSCGRERNLQTGNVTALEGD